VSRPRLVEFLGSDTLDEDDEDVEPAAPPADEDESDRVLDL